MESTQDTSPPQISYPVTEPPIFALVIGIDNYQHGGDTTLRGCVNDSNAVFNFLKNYLYVPKANIVVLQNEQATRKKILDTFESHFIKNLAIAQDDAIIFYFAGHGSRQKAPVDWHAEHNSVETICPYDIAEGFGIPDYTFAHLLRQLTFYKGNNITLIFDSCHSGGMGRAGMDTTRNAPLTRCYYPPEDFPALPADLDHAIWSWSPDGRRCGYSTKPELPGSLYKAMETHVLLAACQPRQGAREIENCGVWTGAFTTALIAALKTWDPRKSSLTYLRMMENLSPLADQHPHCEGKNRVRRLFSPSDRDNDDPSWFVVTAADASGKAYYVAAGYVLGIIEGTEFITHPPDSSTPIKLIATTVEEFRCLAVPHCKETLPGGPDSQRLHTSILPHHSRATILKWRGKWLKVELEPQDAFPNITEDDDTLFSIVKSGGELKASRADSTSGTIQLIRNDPLIGSQPECQNMQLNLDAFTQYYLNKAARFHFFLYQHNKSHVLSQIYRSSHNCTSNAFSVTVSLQRLDWSQHRARPSALTPAGENLFHVPAHNGITTTTLAGAAVLEGLDSNMSYALTLENHTSIDLFPYVFFFDPRNYNIEPLYLPHSSISHPLKRRGTDSSTLGIGYGAHGTEAMIFSLPEGLNHDSAFLKIFVSITYINMEAVVMKSERYGRMANSHLIEHCWDSWTYSVTVRR